MYMYMYVHVCVDIYIVHVCIHCVLWCSLDMGYAQGMNDLLARFLVVTDSEVDAYWMFEHYMTDKRLDFMESSMLRKVCE